MLTLHVHRTMVELRHDAMLDYLHHAGFIVQAFPLYMVIKRLTYWAPVISLQDPQCLSLHHSLKRLHVLK